MDALKLEAFILVAEEESFSAAADRAATAQSTISSRIKELESSLGQQLFIRTSRQVRLSPAGEAALPAAREAVAALSAIREVVDQVAGIRRGRVSLGIVSGAEIPGLGDVVSGFADDYPGIDLVLVSGASADLEKAVAEGTLDIALVVRTVATELHWDGLLRDSLVAIGDIAAKENRITVTALEGERLIVLDAGAGTRTTLEMAARRAGAQLRIAAQVSMPGMAEDLHLRGMGTLIVPSSLAQGRGSRLVDHEGDGLWVDVGLITHPEVRTPAGELLRARLAAELWRE